MQEFSKNRSSRFVARRPVLIAACAVFLVGGGAFAAAGGIDLIKRFFVTVDIAGQPVQLELQPTGDNTQEGTLDTQLADGRQAKIHVKRVEAGSDQAETQVHVNLHGDGSATGNESESSICKGINVGAGSDKAYTLEALGDAEPVHKWTNAAGEGRTLYLIEGDGGGLRIFSVKTATDGTAKVRMLAQLPGALGFNANPQVSVDDHDAITLTWDNGNGDQQQRRVIKLIDKSSGAPADPNAPIQVDTPNGEIKVKVQVKDSGNE